MQANRNDAGMLILVAIGFLLSWISGFSYGRYIVLAPLLLTAFAISRKRPAIFKALALLAAILLFGLFSFALFGTVTLERGFLTEFVVCMVAFTVSFIVGRGLHV